MRRVSHVSFDSAILALINFPKVAIPKKLTHALWLGVKIGGGQMRFKGAGKDQDQSSKSDKNKEEKPTKGARDEFEAIVLVVKDDKILLQKILDKIRKHRDLSQKSILDLGKAQHEAKETARKNRAQ